MPTVLTLDEVKRIIFQTSGVYRLMLSLLYGCGLRLNELLKLRIKNIDFDLNAVYVFLQDTI